MLRHVEENSSGRSPYPEFLSGIFFFLTGLALLTMALLRLGVAAPLTHLLLYLSGLLLVTAAGFLSAFLTASGRRRGVRSRKPASRRIARTFHPLVDKTLAQGQRLWLGMCDIDWRGDWLAVLTVLAVSAVALFALWKGWRLASPPPTGFADQMIVGILLAAAFPLLVLERKYAGLPDRTLPEAPLLERLCRVPLLGILALALAAGLRWLGLSFSTPVEHGVAILTGLVAVEFCLRSLVYIFVPLPPLTMRRSHADSFIAGLIRPQLPNLSAVSASVRRQFGIDLARSWALNFIRRAAIPVLLGMALFTWLLTGVTALGINERAAYEAFGHPQGVLHPGLHVHWPWPFGVLRPVEFGRVRTVSIELAPDDSPPPPATVQGRADQIESAPPPTADRLWDASHPEEASYLVASYANGRQGFEVVNIDLTVLYRIGLGDKAAQQAVYNVASPDTLVTATTGQILARYFGRTTTADVLGQNRQAFILAFQRELQRRLAAVSSGIEVMGVVVEGIHPPPKAAAAYQGVQAAGIEASVKVATAAAEAAREMKMAQLVANTTRNEAMGAAAERVGAAKTDFTLFDGDRKAYATGGAAFLFERRLDRLDKGLADKPLIIVDHRIPPSAAPTVNMLPRGAAGAGGNLTPSDD